MKTVHVFLFAILMVFTTQTNAQGTLPSEQELIPESGKGKVVVIISGYSGPSSVSYMAKDFSNEGYYTVLFNGLDFYVDDNGARLKGVIARAQGSPHALPGKVGLVAFSMGGGYALTYGTMMSDLVSGVALFYPMTMDIPDPVALGSKIKVPTLLLAGVKDYRPVNGRGCCLIETARKIADGARKGDSAALLEFVEYPNADHAFTIKNSPNYRADDAADGFRRTLEHLRKNFAG